MKKITIFAIICNKFSVRDIMKYRLCRSASDRRIAGVCGGIAEFFGVDSYKVRIGIILFALITGGTAILIYLILWWLIPDGWGRY